MLRLGRITLLGALVGTIDTASSTGVANTPIGSLGETLALNRITEWLPISRDAEHEMGTFRAAQRCIFAGKQPSTSATEQRPSDGYMIGN